MNRLGKLHRHYDEAGLLAFEAYDFKGNLLEKSRRVIGDEADPAVFNSPPPDWQVAAFRVDWQSDGATLEERAATLLDATLTNLGHLRRAQPLDDAVPAGCGRRAEGTAPAYNRAGALESVVLDGATYVERIAYNAKGQRC